MNRHNRNHTNPPFYYRKKLSKMLFIVEKGQREKNLHISRQAQIQYILELFSSSSLTFLVSNEPFSKKKKKSFRNVVSLLSVFYVWIFLMVFLVCLVFYSWL